MLVNSDTELQAIADRSSARAFSDNMSQKEASGKGRGLLKRLTVIFFCCLMLNGCIFNVPVFAEGHDAAEVRTVRAGFFEFDGYHMMSETGRRSGYGYDFLQEIARYQNWKYQYIGYDKTWSEMQDMLEDGTIDILTSAQKTPEREQKFDFSDKSIGTSSAILTVKSGNTRYAAGDYAAYNGMIIGQLNNSSRNDSLSEFAEEKGFTYISKFFDDTASMTDALQKGTVDALLTSNLRVISNEWILDQFAPSDFYAIVKKGNTELLSEINEAIAKLDDSYPDWRTELWNKYYLADAGAEIPFTADERAFISEAKSSGTKLTAIVEPDRAPYSYFENGKAKGIMPEIFYKIEDLTGLDFDIIEADGRNDYFRRIEGKEHIDVRIDSFADYYAAETTGFKLTDSYLTATISKVTRKTATSSVTVAVTEKGDPTDLRISLLNGDVPLVYYPSIADCINAVKNGKASETYLYTYSAQQYLDQDATGSLMSVLLPQYQISFALGVALDDDPRLMTILDKAINYVNGSITHEIILDQTKAVQQSLTFKEYLLANPVLLAGLIAGLALMAGLAAALIYRRHAVQLIKKKNAELNVAIERANKANEAKTSFLSSMSHDMRTPLNGIIGFTDFALQTSDPEKKQEYLSKVQKSSAVLLGLINDTLDVSRIESGKVRLSPEYISVRTAFDDLCIVIDSSARQKNIQFTSRFNIPDNLEAFVDKLKLQEIFMNLLSNAIKFTPDGGIVQFFGEETGSHDHISDFKFIVQDTGIGMSLQFQKEMYEPFTQEMSSQNGGGTGTGLGLYISKRYVELMKGRIEVQSEPGHGTVFTVYISAASRKAQPAPEKNSGQDADFTGKCIMVTEDNIFNSEIARTLLEHKGASVITAVNGQQAAELFKNKPAGTFDAILMDVHMPVMGGYEATGNIRKMDKSDAETVPIIAMTADAYDEDIKNCLKAGMNGHIAKPIDPALMFGVLDRWMNQ